MNKTCVLTIVFLFTIILGNAQDNKVLKNKTLVVWVSLDNIEQFGGSAITIDDQNGHFDGIVYGEKYKYKWMGGSELFNRVEKDQYNNAKEDSKNTLIQMAIVYNDRKVSIYRNGELYTSYTIDQPMSFPNSSAVVFGIRHIEAMDKENSLACRIKDARIYATALSQSDIATLKPGVESSVPGLWAWWNFSDGSLHDKTQLFNDLKIIGNPAIKDGYLVLPGKGASLIAYNKADNNALPDGTAVSYKMISMNKAFRDRVLSDRYRPAYHFCFPEDDGSTGDPNGAFYKDGRYHLMYLYNDKNTGYKWGHMSSTNLLHWRFHPDAIGPSDGDEGCFSGGAFVDDDGSVTLSYWMLWGDKGIGLATSKDHYHEKWEKYKGNPVIKSDAWGITEMKDEQGRDIHVGSADPSNIWKKDGKYYMITGNLLVLHKYGLNDSIKEEQGDRVYLFESNDLKNWKYRHRFYESKREWTGFNEDNMCPSFLPLPKSPDGGKPSDKYLLLFISHNKGCQYYIGDYKNDKFFPDHHGRMTWNDNAFFAPEALVDGKGRQIMWSWIFDGRPDSLIRYYGWAGTYSLPRTLWLGNDGSLRIAPVKELESLRLNQRSFSNLKINAGEEMKLDEPGNDLMEMEIQFNPNKASQFGVRVYKSDDGREETVIYYDRTDKKLKFDTRKSSVETIGRKILEEAPLDLNANEPLTLRIFIDKSVIEVFANDRQAIARLVYPTLGGRGISLFSEGENIGVKSVKFWEMTPSNPF